MSKRTEVSLLLLSWALWGELMLWGYIHEWQLTNFLEFQYLWVLVVAPIALVIWPIVKFVR